MIISFINRKGGCGKTTLLTLTAVAIKQRTDKKVLIVDTDDQRSIYSLRQDETPTIKLLKPDQYENSADVIAFSFNKKNAADVPVLRFANMLNENLKEYDLIFIDAPGMMTGDITPAIVQLSDVVILPLLASIFDLNSTIDFLNLIDASAADRTDKLTVIGVVNKRDRTTEYRSIDQLDGVAGMKILRSSLSHWVGYRRLSTISQHVHPDKDHEFNDYYKELTKLLKI